MNKQKLIELRCKAWGITETEYFCNQCSDFSLEDMARAYRRGKNKGARDKAIQNVGFYQKQMQDIYDKENKQIADLKAQNKELTLKISRLESYCDAYNYSQRTYQDEIKELKELVEKMKCCTEWQTGEPIKGREIFARNVANCNLLATYFSGAWRNVWNGAVIDFNKITMWRYTGFKNNGEEIDCKELKENE